MRFFYLFQFALGKKFWNLFHLQPMRDQKVGENIITLHEDFVITIEIPEVTLLFVYARVNFNTSLACN